MINSISAISVLGSSVIVVVVIRLRSVYKASNFYAPEYERCILWNDPDLAINWPLSGEPLVSAKDMKGLPFKEAEYL